MMYVLYHIPARKSSGKCNFHALHRLYAPSLITPASLQSACELARRSRPFSPLRPLSPYSPLPNSTPRSPPSGAYLHPAIATITTPMQIIIFSIAVLFLNHLTLVACLVSLFRLPPTLVRRRFHSVRRDAKHYRCGFHQNRLHHAALYERLKRGETGALTREY